MLPDGDITNAILLSTSMTHGNKSNIFGKTLRALEASNVNNLSQEGHSHLLANTGNGHNQF